MYICREGASVYNEAKGVCVRERAEMVCMYKERKYVYMTGERCVCERVCRECAYLNVTRGRLREYLYLPRGSAHRYRDKGVCGRERPARVCVYKERE